MLDQASPGGSRIARSDGGHQRTVVRREGRQRHVEPDRHQAQPELGQERLVRSSQPGAPGGAHDRAMHGHVGLHDPAPRGVRREPLERVDRLGDARPAGWMFRGSGRGLALDETAEEVDVREIAASQRPDPHPAVRLATNEAEVDELCQRHPQGLATDMQLLGQLDLAQVGAALELAVENATSEFADRSLGR